MDDLDREDIGEVLGELDELRKGGFAISTIDPLDKARLADLAGRTVDHMDTLLRWQNAAEIVLLHVTVGKLPALNAIAIAAARSQSQVSEPVVPEQ